MRPSTTEKILLTNSASYWHARVQSGEKLTSMILGLRSSVSITSNPYTANGLNGVSPFMPSGCGCEHAALSTSRNRGEIVSKTLPGHQLEGGRTLAFHSTVDLFLHRSPIQPCVLLFHVLDKGLIMHLRHLVVGVVHDCKVFFIVVDGICRQRSL